jgi:hypothetical protein
VNGHLDALFSPSTLKDEIEPIWFAELCEDSLDTFFRPAELFVDGFGLVNGRKAEYVGGKAVGLGEIKTGLVDIYGGDAGGALSRCECASEDANRAHAKNENRLACDKFCSFRGMENDGEWFCEGG